MYENYGHFHLEAVLKTMLEEAFDKLMWIVSKMRYEIYVTTRYRHFSYVS